MEFFRKWVDRFRQRRMNYGFGIFTGRVSSTAMKQARFVATAGRACGLSTLAMRLDRTIKEGNKHVA